MSSCFVVRLIFSQRYFCSMIPLNVPSLAISANRYDKRWTKYFPIFAKLLLGNVKNTRKMLFERPNFGILCFIRAYCGRLTLRESGNWITLMMTPVVSKSLFVIQFNLQVHTVFIPGNRWRWHQDFISIQTGWSLFTSFRINNGRNNYWIEILSILYASTRCRCS